MREKKTQLRYGFTTGTCAAAAAKAAAVILLRGEYLDYIKLMTPKQIEAKLIIETAELRDSSAFCAVRKDAGDDPDVTDQCLVCAKISYIEDISEDWYHSEEYPGLYLTGGSGVGVVTRPGLSCPVGKSAINPVPRAMIFSAVGEVADTERKLLITVSIPKGEALAERTFNPNLGIRGGISILGTSGIVEPMSEQALLDTICLEIHMKAVEGKRRLVLVLGNYGVDFLVKRCDFPAQEAVKCSNFIAEAVECAMREGFKQLYLAGHLGKLIKVAYGARNTHSKYGDGRMEALADCTKACLMREDKDHPVLIEQVKSSNTTEEALEQLEKADMIKPVMDEAAYRVKAYLDLWSLGKLETEVVTFSTVYDILGVAK